MKEKNMKQSFITTAATLAVATTVCIFTACGESNKTVGITEEATGIADNDLSSDSKDPKSSSSKKEDPKSSSSKGNVSSSSNGDDSSSSVEQSSSSAKVETFSGKLTGYAQKGPFVSGTTVTLQGVKVVTIKEVNEETHQEVEKKTFKLSETKFSDEIKNNMGEYEISYKDLSSELVLLEAEGYYLNENSGEKSSTTIRLNALSDLANRSTANINVLTHLEYNRVKYLMLKKEMNYNDAKAQAENEILKAFHIPSLNGATAEDLSIVGASENNSALLVLSILLQGSVDGNVLMARLNSIAEDLEEDGIIDDKQMFTDIADEALWLVPRDIRENIHEWNLVHEGTSDVDYVPAFENAITNYWENTLGIGECTKNNLGNTTEVKNELSNNNGRVLICTDYEPMGIAWKVFVEKDKLNSSCTAEEEGAVFENSLICHSGKWIQATPADEGRECIENYYGKADTLETYHNFSSNERLDYVCDEGGWRLMTELEIELNWVCTHDSYQNRMVVCHNNKVYQCLDYQWTETTAEAANVPNQQCEDGQIFFGL